MVEMTTKHTERLEITYDMFMSAVDRLVEKVLQSKRKYEALYAIPRGGLVLGVYLAHRLKLPMAPRPRKNVLVVDDICDTGMTLELSRYKECDKIVVVTKSAGLDTCPDLIYAHAVANHIWIRFPWEIDDV